jgi:invasion protein IalB
MTTQIFRKASCSPISPLIALLIAPLFSLYPTSGQQMAQAAGAAANEKPNGEFAPRGQRAAREIKYGDWQKFCFKVPGAKTVCRTTISGTFETGQAAVRLDLIEREGETATRLQMFLPVGLYLQSGVKLTVDQGSAYRLPYIWCLTNTCIAADLADPKLVNEMENGQKLSIEIVDSSVLVVGTLLPLERFGAVRQEKPAHIYEQAIDE